MCARLDNPAIKADLSAFAAGVRLFNRTTRSIAPTEAGARLLERLLPALSEVEPALDVVNNFRDRPAGTLRLNVPASVSRLVLPAIVPSLLRAYPGRRYLPAPLRAFVDFIRPPAPPARAAR